jgi:hypothetical protein
LGGLGEFSVVEKAVRVGVGAVEVLGEARRGFADCQSTIVVVIEATK